MIMTVRQTMERLEEQYLSPYASFSSKSRGRDEQEEPCDIRTVYQRDRDRILHSKAFRRLKHKTQVFLSPEGDHYRTRLTHTLEVSQIARTIAKSLRLNEDLTEAIALGHDLGHTPFGHSGEHVLDQICPEGFAHYEQSVRVVERLEKGGKGLNLTWEVRDGIRNHRTSGHPSTLEGAVVRLSDKIAYINHDIDDAIRAKLFVEEDLPSRFTDVLGHSVRERLNLAIHDTIAKIFVEGDLPERYTAVLGHSVRDRLNNMVHDIITQSLDKPEIQMSPGMEEAMKGLRQWMFDHVYCSDIPKAEEEKAKQLIVFLYQYYCSHVDRLPREYQIMMEERNEKKERVVCDYIAGMSDRYAIDKFEELFIPQAWKV